MDYAVFSECVRILYKLRGCYAWWWHVSDVYDSTGRGCGALWFVSGCFIGLIPKRDDVIATMYRGLLG